MKLHYKLILLVVSILAFTACKKGENDPFLSLKSRDARLAGNWIVASSNSSTINRWENTDGTSDSSMYIYDFDGTTMYQQSYNSGPFEVDYETSYSYSRAYTFEKNGDYVINTSEGESDLKEEGNWTWLDNSKKKTNIQLVDQNINRNYQVDRLTNKELVLKKEFYSEIVSADYLSTTTISETIILEKN